MIADPLIRITCNDTADFLLSSKTKQKNPSSSWVSSAAMSVLYGHLASGYEKAFGGVSQGSGVHIQGVDSVFQHEFIVLDYSEITKYTLSVYVAHGTDQCDLDSASGEFKCFE